MATPGTHRRIALLSLPLAALVALAAGCGGSSSSNGTSAAQSAPAPAASSSGATALEGSVGPGYTISLMQNGQPVKTLKPGSYSITVDDRSSIHNFTLEQESGGSFEQDLTDISDTGTKTVKVTLGKGEWKFYCSAHESQMNGSFTVS